MSGEVEDAELGGRAGCRSPLFPSLIQGNQSCPGDAVSLDGTSSRKQAGADAVNDRFMLAQLALVLGLVNFFRPFVNFGNRLA